MTLPEETEQLLSDLRTLIETFVAWPESHHGAVVAAWVLHAHAIEAFDSTPRLALMSAEKQSGKTRALEVLDLVVPRSAMRSSMSAPSLFRMIDKKQPTVLLDEVDTIFGRATETFEELRGMLNSGHRRGATVSRCTGDGGNIRETEFRVFCATALAGIGDLPDTVTDRSILIRMKRRNPADRVEPFRHRAAKVEADVIKERCEAWAAAAVPALDGNYPEMSPLADRPADVWEPLFAIADLAGDDWSGWIRAAAGVMTGTGSEGNQSLGVRLLADCRQVFAASNAERFPSAQLVASLNAIEEAPWGDLQGRPLDARRLAQQLRPFDVRPRKIRLSESDVTLQGYTRRVFHDAWQRYLPAEGS